MTSIYIGGWLLNVFAGAFWLGASYLIVTVAYNGVFHPLARYPGPFWARILPMYAIYHAYCKDLHRNIQRCHETYGPVVRYSPDRLVFNTAEALRDIYGHGKNTQKPKDYAPHPPALKVNIHNCIDKEAHGRKRRIIGQSFAAATITLYEPVIIDHVRNLCEVILATADIDWPLINEESWSLPQDIALWMDYLTMDIISNIIYGQSLNLTTNCDHRGLVNTIMASSCHHYSGTSLPTLLDAKFDKWFNPDKSMSSPPANERQRLSSVLAKLTEERTHSEDRLVDRNDLTSILSDAHDPKTGDKFTEAEVRDEAREMLAAGSNTTATTLSSTISHLSRHPAAYARLTEEVRSTFPSIEHIRQGPPLTSCHYLRACLDESMRLTPPHPGLFWREVAPPGATIANEHIPAGYEVAVDLWAIHHNPAYFPDPFVFNPDRFMPRNVEREPTLNKPKFDFFPMSRANTIFPTSPSTRSPNSFQGMNFPICAEARENKAFVPFLLGPRSCVGKPLAYLEMSLALARMVWCMDFRAADVGVEGRGMVDGFAGSQKGTMLQFRRRKGVGI